MWIIVDKSIPKPAKEELSAFGSLLELESRNIVYDAISGHPDIFLFQTGNKLIIAPNTPEKFVKKLKDCPIDFSYGNLSLGMKYPDTAKYNAVVTDNFLIHNSKVTDPSVTKSCKERKYIHTNQAYTRCNLIALGENHFITSDKGIESTLSAYPANVLYVAPDGIELQGFSNGFFGGCCGVFDKKLFIIGSLKYFSAKDNVNGFVKNADHTIIELYDGPLVDGGGIFFLNP
jgi:hypothetical protein